MCVQKVKLMDFEQRFQEKVMEVDDKYRLKLQDLMTQNTELKSVTTFLKTDVYRTCYRLEITVPVGWALNTNN